MCRTLLSKFLFAVVYVLCVQVIDLSECLREGDVGVCAEPVYDKACKKKECIELVCCDNYIYKKKKCVPECKFGCKDGQCVAPNVCKCEPPLILKDGSSCVLPKCDPKCVNAVCDLSDKCNCIKDHYPVNKSHCELCPAGHFIEPVTQQCKPLCDKPCVNGICTGRNQCACFPGYKNKDTFECIPECNPSCNNGTCSAPNTCLCPEGNRLKNGYDCIPVCDICDNGQCIGPNICKCNKGYSKKNGTICTPDCKDCENGLCIRPNYCECKVGYSKKNGTDKCTPDCKLGCINGMCSEPDVCSCATGHALKNNTCIPICDPQCENAKCVQPNNCVCLPGYHKTTDGSVCHPKCRSCKNGKCIAPNICRCNPGYELNNGICSPVCSQSCVNSFCSLPEVCTCNDGYVNNSSQPNVCYIPCKSLCLNGTCENGSCICDEGYELKNETCSALTIENCEKCEGSCDDSERCICRDGRPCSFPVTSESEIGMPVGLAGLQITWLVAGAVCLLLVTLVLVVLRQMWKKRIHNKNNQSDTNGNHFNGSVVFTMPNTLLTRDDIPEHDHELDQSQDNDYHEVNERADEEDKQNVNIDLLRPGTQLRRDT